MSLPRSGDVAVVGAGIIGLSVAFDLARRGAAVSLYDASEAARAASWAAAGMLAPSTEHIAEPALRSLCERSLSLYPSFAQAVQAASSVDPHLRLEGILSAAHGESALHALERRFAEISAHGTRVELLDRESALKLEPALGRSLRSALIVRGEGYVDNRRLGRALALAGAAAGVRIHENAGRVFVECDARRVLGLRSDLGFQPADHVINAAGAWAGTLQGVPPQYALPVHPVKGQMVALAMPAEFIRRPVWLDGAYLVPRAGGRLLIGATSEEAGYDTRVTAGAIDQLIHAAVGAIPALRDFSVTESWAGLRPATPDGMPFIGPTELRGYAVAAGHYRNGILLAPATAKALGDWIERGSTEELEPFLPERNRKAKSA